MESNQPAGLRPHPFGRGLSSSNRVSTFADTMTKLTVLLGFFLSLAGCWTPQVISPVQSGDPELVNGSVVFGGIDGNLYATRPEGDIVRITPDAADNRVETIYSAYGWLGSRVVYSAQELHPDQEIVGSVYSAIPGENPDRLVRLKGFAPFFLYPSPDNNRVAYLGSTIGQQGFLMGSVDLSGRRDIVHGIGQPFFAAWSPDGFRLLTHVGVPFGPAGSVMRFQSVEEMLGGGSPEPRLNIEPGNFQAPAYAPDGDRIAVALRQRRSQTVSVISEDGSIVTDIAPLDGLAAMAWSPTGSHLAFIDGRYLQTGGIVGPLRVSGPNGTLQEVAGRVAAFFWAPDGSKIIYLEPFFAGSGAGGGLLYRIGLFRLTDSEPESIAVLRPTEAFVRQIVPFFDQYHRAYTIWSPDSRLLVLNSTGSAGEPLIHLVDTERQRTGDQFSVRFSVQAQSPELGLITEEGVSSRVLAWGTNPFFSRETLLSPPPGDRQGTDFLLTRIPSRDG